MDLSTWVRRNGSLSGMGLERNGKTAFYVHELGFFRSHAALNKWPLYANIAILSNLNFRPEGV